VIAESAVYQCIIPESEKILATQKNLSHYYSQDHPGEKRNRSITAFQKLFQTIEFSGRRERRILGQRSADEAGQQFPAEEIVQVRR
jgi:hypothetical protein